MTPFNTTTRQRLGILATACLLSVALPAGSAWVLEAWPQARLSLLQQAPAVFSRPRGAGEVRAPAWLARWLQPKWLRGWIAPTLAGRV